MTVVTGDSRSTANMTRSGHDAPDDADQSRAREDGPGDAEVVEAAIANIQRAALAMVGSDGQPPGKSTRVRFVRRLMEDGFWVRGRTAPALAEAWGLKKATVEHDSAEASHQLEDPAELDRGRARVATRSIDWADEAHARGEYDSAGRLLELHGRVTGAITSGAPVQVLVDARTGDYRPEVRREVDAAVGEALALAERAAVRLGLPAGALAAAMRDAASEGDGPVLVETTGEGRDR